MLDVATEPATLLRETINHSRAAVTVAVTLYNYAAVVVEALDSVAAQDLPDLDLIVVDDGSTDGGEQHVVRWLEANGDRFGRCMLMQHMRNSGLAAGRNLAFVSASTPYVFVLDADNQLYPRCLSACLSAAKAADADAAFTILEVFGEREGIMNTDPWSPRVLQRGNYIDAMALISKDTWERVGGYRSMPVAGWEDYDLWLKFAEAGFDVIQVPEILGRYRYAASSMLQSITNRPETLAALHGDLRQHHPAVTLGMAPR